MKSPVTSGTYSFHVEASPYRPRVACSRKPPQSPTRPTRSHAETPGTAVLLLSVLPALLAIRWTAHGGTSTARTPCPWPAGLFQAQRCLVHLTHCPNIADMEILQLDGSDVYVLLRLISPGSSTGFSGTEQESHCSYTARVRLES